MKSKRHKLLVQCLAHFWEENSVRAVPFNRLSLKTDTRNANRFVLSSPHKWSWISPYKKELLWYFSSHFENLYFPPSFYIYCSFDYMRAGNEGQFYLMVHFDDKSPGCLIHSDSRLQHLRIRSLEKDESRCSDSIIY